VYLPWSPAPNPDKSSSWWLQTRLLQMQHVPRLPVWFSTSFKSAQSSSGGVWGGDVVMKERQNALPPEIGEAGGCDFASRPFSVPWEASTL
jgi:hypothetical protein